MTASSLSSFQQELARTRLGVELVVVPGRHLAAPSQPDALAAAILAATCGQALTSGEGRCRPRVDREAGTCAGAQ
jgi:hypothetical protein